MPIISILVPVFNTQYYIEKCLDSILNQTFTDYEVIIVDDGSTDDSLKIIKRYAEKEEKIHFVHTENQGEACARQLALDISKGKYIASVDSDDWIEPLMLEVLYNLLIDHNGEASCAGWYKDSENGMELEQKAPSEQPIEISAGKLMLERFYLGIFHGTLTCYLFNRRLFEGFNFPANIAVGCDFAALFYVMKNCKRVITTNEKYYHYIQRGDSAIHSNLNQGKINAYYYEQKIEQEAIILMPEIKKAINMWYLQNNLFLVSAMVRSDNYNWDIIKEIRKKILKKYYLIFICSYMRISFKVGIFILGLSGKLYLKWYKFIIYKCEKLYTLVTNNKISRDV